MNRLQCLLAPIVAAFPAVAYALDPGTARGDLMADGCTLLGCRAMGERLLEALED